MSTYQLPTNRSPRISDVLHKQVDIQIATGYNYHRSGSSFVMEDPRMDRRPDYSLLSVKPVPAFHQPPRAALQPRPVFKEFSKKVLMDLVTDKARVDDFGPFGPEPGETNDSDERRRGVEVHACRGQQGQHASNYADPGAARRVTALFRKYGRARQKSHACEMETKP